MFALADMIQQMVSGGRNVYWVLVECEEERSFTGLVDWDGDGGESDGEGDEALC